MDYEKNLLNIRSPLHFACVVAGASSSGKSADRDDRGRPARAIFLLEAIHDIDSISGRESSVGASGELIKNISKVASDRWKLRNYGLSTAVDKAVRNSNLNHDFRLRALADKVRNKGVKE